MSRKEPIHLGDGAYVQEGGYSGEIVLTTGSHVLEESHAKIFLGPDETKRLLKWLTPPEKVEEPTTWLVSDE